MRDVQERVEEVEDVDSGIKRALLLASRLRRGCQSPSERFAFCKRGFVSVLALAKNTFQVLYKLPDDTLPREDVINRSSPSRTRP